MVGQERFKIIPAHYYRDRNGILVVYDITDRESFNNLNFWLSEIEKNRNKDVFKLLIGNKIDLESKRKITYDEGKDFASINRMEFFETSAKTAYNVQEAFESLIRNIMSKDKNLNKKPKNIKLEIGNSKDNLVKKKKFC